ncbi:DUF2589 domain-containing protein [Streptomyces sp. NPDC017546]|uniref:DUF2589 domain-containing protein n=1 Tax=unclassified Streptomyces TaxID=2593676 RepID=UPI00235E026E|nr:DUF2589 domain-containing protein [Streptomyces sp. MMBL 11-1]
MSDDDVPVSALLGAAYEAVVHGQGLAAREAVELVRDLGFEKDGTAKPFRFAYQHTEATEAGPQVRTVHATVPLLSLINPPVISIDKAEISMSLQLISQGTETGPTDTAATGGGTPAAETATPTLKGRIVHKNDSNAVMTIESTLKQRDLLGSSRLSQLLDAAVSDRDSVWYQVLGRADPFREAATALIDAVDKDGTTGQGEGVHGWLQQVWQLKESVTDAVSAFRDGQPEKIPGLHQNWNDRCGGLDWVDRHTESEELTRLRRTFLATARAVWNALLPGEPVAEFGPPTVDQLRIRFEAAVAALAAAPPRLTGLPERLHQLEGAVAQGCIAHTYEDPTAVAETLKRYNETAGEIREMWGPSAQVRGFWPVQDNAATAAQQVWDALVPQAVPDDFRAGRMTADELEATCMELTLKLEDLTDPLLAAVKTESVNTACGLAEEGWGSAQSVLENETPFRSVDECLTLYNQEIDSVNRAAGNLKPSADAWNSAAESWNKTARQIWEYVIDVESHPVTEVVSVGSS